MNLCAEDLEVGATYAAFPELLGVNGRSEVETPCVVSHRILPVDETFRGLSDACAFNAKDHGQCAQKGKD